MDKKSIIAKAIHNISGCPSHTGYHNCSMADRHEDHAAIISNALESVYLGTQVSRVDAAEYVSVVASLGVADLSNKQMKSIASATGMSIGHIKTIMERAKMSSGG